MRYFLVGFESQRTINDDSEMCNRLAIYMHSCMVLILCVSPVINMSDALSLSSETDVIDMRESKRARQLVCSKQKY
jgi:hypothetical protein